MEKRKLAFCTLFPPFELDSISKVFILIFLKRSSAFPTHSMDPKAHPTKKWMHLCPGIIEMGDLVSCWSSYGASYERACIFRTEGCCTFFRYLWYTTGMERLPRMDSVSSHPPFYSKVLQGSWKAAKCCHLQDFENSLSYYHFILLFTLWLKNVWKRASIHFALLVVICILQFWIAKLLVAN